MNFLVSEDIDFLNLDAIKHRKNNLSLINLVCTKYYTLTDHENSGSTERITMKVGTQVSLR